MLKLRLREHREARGWSLEHVGSKVGASAPHVSELERGKKRINNDWLQKFALLYKVPIRDLIDDSESPVDAALLELTLACEDLSGDDVARVRDFALALGRSAKESGHTQ